MTIDEGRLDAIVNQVLSELRSERGLSQREQLEQTDYGDGGGQGYQTAEPSLISTGQYPDVDSAVEAALPAYGDRAPHVMAIAIPMMPVRSEPTTTSKRSATHSEGLMPLSTA